MSSNAPTAWSWDFGDGGSDTVQNPSHTYTAANTYTVSLTATNALGSNTCTKAGYITVNAPPPPPVTADFSATPTSGPAPLTVQFTDASAGATGWFWSFGDGATSTEQNPSHEYAYAGTMSVILIASIGGANYTATKTNYITVTRAGHYLTVIGRLVEGPHQPR